MYKMLTGLTPQESIERMHHDELKEPSKLKVKIDKNKENALMNALNIDAQTRTQTAKQLLEELSGGEDVLRHRVIQHKKDEGKWPLWMKTAVCAIPLLIIMSTMLIVSGGQVKTNDAFTTVPNVIGRQETDAREVFQGSDLQMVVAGTTPVDFGESGTVQSINPESGSFIRRFETVEVLLAVNETVFMPDVVYWDVDDAVQRLEEAGFNTKVEYEQTEAYAEDVVFWQQYPEGEGLPRNTLITIKAAVGAPGAQKDDLREVPDIVGMPVKQAAEVLSEAGFHLCITAEQNDSSAYGTVLAQTQAGETAPKGTVIAVTISIGNEFARMPDLFLKTKAEAAQLLAGLGLQVEYAYEVNNDYNEDLVLRQSEPAGTKIPLGGTVTLTLSKYEYANVPNVVGKNRQAAEKAITDAGFEVNVSDEVVYSETIQKGFILAQSATGQFPKGRTVTLTVSAGQTDKKATVPDVTGLNRSDAEYRLSTAEFMFADGGEAYSETVKKGLVISYSPTGSQRLGTVVTCVFSKGPEPKAVPNVAGQSQMAATNALTAIGMTVSTASAHSETVPYGSVISQSVSAGTLVDSGTPIVLTLSCGTAGRMVSEEEVGAYRNGQYNITTQVEYSYRYQNKERTQSAKASSGWSIEETETWTSTEATTQDPSAIQPQVIGDATKEVKSYTTYYHYHVWGWEHNGDVAFIYGPTKEGVMSWVKKNYSAGTNTGYREFTITTTADHGAEWSGYNGSTDQGFKMINVKMYYQGKDYSATYKWTRYHLWRWGSWSGWSEWSSSDNTPTGADVNAETKTKNVYYVVGKPF